MGNNRNNTDTFIERVFIEKVEKTISEKTLRKTIISSWQNEKYLYVNKLKTIAFEFMHYSLHDESHSRSILDNIELLLGKNLIRQLSACDLWLLLEAAYSHDIGMCTDLKELSEIWSDENKIQKIIYEIEQTDDSEVISDYIELLEKCKSEDNRLLLSNNKIPNNWPVHVRHAVMHIDAYYIRKKHAERSKEYVINHVSQKRLIENRLYKIVADIDYSHGDDFENLANYLLVEEVGFETEKVHPLFIAMLLRIGDVLDIRNNRFNEAFVEYQNGLKGESAKHYDKHKSVKHFLISQECVDIEIKSDEIEVCINSRSWLDKIDNELKNYINNWSKFAPSHFPGLRLKDIKLKVFHNDVEFLSTQSALSFKINSINVVTLLTGGNIYDTNLIFLREYIQNAYDAMKIRVGKDLQKEYQTSFANSNINLKDLTPKDIRSNFFAKYRLKINVEESDKSEQGNKLFKIDIVDEGIGMDEEGIKSLLTIGSSWGVRNSVNDVYYSIPKWLKPTGGFGIGILSGFLIADKIEIKTKAEGSSGYKLVMHSPKKGGKINRSEDPNITDIGTTISLQINFNDYYREVIKLFKKDDYSPLENTFAKKYQVANNSPFHAVVDDYLEFVTKTLIMLCEYYLIDTPFYTKVSDNNSHFVKNIGLINNKELFKKMKINQFDEYEIDDNKDEFKFVEWDEDKEAFIGFDFYKLFNSKYRTLRWAYKSVYVKNPENDVDFKIKIIKEKNKVDEFNVAFVKKLSVIECCVGFIDYWNSDVKSILKVSRDSFKDIETVIPIIDSIMVKIVNTLFFNSNKRDLLIDSYIYNNRQLTPESSDNKEQYYRKLLNFMFKLVTMSFENIINIEESKLDEFESSYPKNAFKIACERDYSVVNELIDIKNKLQKVEKLVGIKGRLYNALREKLLNISAEKDDKTIADLRNFFVEKSHNEETIKDKHYKKYIEKSIEVTHKYSPRKCCRELEMLYDNYIKKSCVSVIGKIREHKERFVAVNEDFKGDYLSHEIVYYYILDNDEFKMLRDYYEERTQQECTDNIVRLSLVENENNNSKDNESETTLNVNSFNVGDNANDRRYVRFKKLCKEQKDKYDPIILKTSSILEFDSKYEYCIMNPFIVKKESRNYISIDEYYRQLKKMDDEVDLNKYLDKVLIEEDSFKELTNTVFVIKSGVENKKYTLDKIQDTYKRFIKDMLIEFEELKTNKNDISRKGSLKN